MAQITDSTKELNKARAFAENLRGTYIIGQALYYAIKELEKVPKPFREVSNISDMQYLRDNLYNFPDEYYNVSDEVKELWHKE